MSLFWFKSASIDTNFVRYTRYKFQNSVFSMLETYYKVNYLELLDYISLIYLVNIFS